MILKFFKWLIGALAISLLLAVGIMAWLGNSQAGTRWLIEKGISSTGADVQIASIDGSLLNGLTFSGLRYQASDQSLSLRRLYFDWSAAALLSRDLKINALELDGLRFHSDAPAEESSEPFEIPELPVSIHLQQFAMTDAEIRSGESSHRIESLTISAEASGRSLRIKGLELRAEGATASAHGDVSLDDDRSLDLTLALDADTPDFGPVTASAMMGGTIKNIAIQAVISAPFRLDINGTVQPDGLYTQVALKGLWHDVTWPLQGEPTYHSPEGSFLLNGDISALKSELDVTLSGEAPVRRLQLQALSRLNADSDDYPFESAIQWETHDNRDRTYVGQAQISGDKHHADFEHRLTAPVELSSAGRIDYSADLPGFELVNRWENLVWPINPDEQLRSAKGELRAFGTPDQYTVELDTTVASTSIPETALTLRSTGDRESLAIQLLEARTLGGAIRINGSLAWQEQISWDLTLAADNINPGIHWSEYPGKLNADAKTTGSLTDGSAQYALSISSLAGKLREWPIRAKADLKGHDMEIQLTEIDLRLGRNILNAKGLIGDKLDLAFNLSAPALEEIMPDADGSLKARGKITGPVRNPGIVAELSGTGVAYQASTVAMLAAKINYDPLGTNPSNAHIEVHELISGSQTVSAVIVDASGTPANHRFISTVNADLGNLSLRGSGSYADEAWQGNLSEADLLKTGAGDWTLQSAVKIRLSKAGVNTSEACWTQRAARVCAQSNADKNRAMSASFNVEALPLALLSPFLPSGLQLSSVANLDASWEKKPAAAATFKAQLTIPEGSVHYTDEENVTNELPWQKIEFRAQGVDQKVTAELNLILNDSDHAKAALDLANYQSPASPISGNLNAHFRKLSVLNPWIPDLVWTSGALDIDARLGGNLAEPQVSGSAALNDGAIEVNALGISIEALTLLAKADNQTRVNISGSASSGDGKLNVAGYVLTEPKLGWPSEIKITGEQFEATRLPEIGVEISPDLDISADRSGGKVTGRVALDKLDVKINKLPESAVSVSEDELIVGSDDDAAANALKTKWDTKIELEVPSTSSLEGFGLNTNMTGTLSIRQEHGAPLSVLGELGLLNGRYKAFGQDLSITRGRFIFSGPSDNPGVDFEAERRATIDDVVAGLRVGGTLKSPVTEIYSRPSLPQNDALAYLLLGKPLSSASSGEGNLLANAALALGARGSAPLTQRVGKRIGLDELGVQTDGGLEQSGLVLGKQLSSRLNLRYVYGLFSRIGGLLLEYRLTKSLSLEARAGEAQTVDLLYRHERD